MAKKQKNTNEQKPLSDGRDAGGKFTAGNNYGRGNPLGKACNDLRVALINRVRPDDIQDIVDMLLLKAKKGNLRAVREILNRTIGLPIQTDIIEKLENLERVVEELSQEKESNL